MDNNGSVRGSTPKKQVNKVSGEDSNAGKVGTDTFIVLSPKEISDLPSTYAVSNNKNSKAKASLKEINQMQVNSQGRVPPSVSSTLVQPGEEGARNEILIDNDQDTRQVKKQFILGRLISKFTKKIEDQGQQTHYRQTNITHTDTIEELNKQEELDNKVDELGSQKETFMEKYLPMQTIIMIGIVLMVLLVATAAVSLIPLNVKKDALERRMLSLGMSVKIDGGVFFNPFLGSFMVHNASVGMTAPTQQPGGCRSFVQINAPIVKINILTGAVTIRGGQIEVRTDGDGIKAYEALSAIDYSQISRKIYVDESVLAVGSCMVNENNAAQGLSASGGALISVAVEKFDIYKDNDVREISGIFAFEGQTIEAKYNERGLYTKQLSINASFGSLSLGIKMSDNNKTSIPKVGNISAVITNGPEFAKIIGLREADRSYDVVSNLTLKLNSVIDFDEKLGFKINTNIFSSHGNGTILANFPISETIIKAPANINVTFPELAIYTIPNKTAKDSSARFLGLWRIVQLGFVGFNHEATIGIGKIRLSNTNSAITDLKLKYLINKGVLDASQTNLSMNFGSTRVWSVKNENLNQESSSRAFSMQGLTEFILPLQVEGNNLYECLSILRSIFKIGGKLTAKVNQPDENVLPSKSVKVPFNGGSNFFISYSKRDYGFKDINLTVDEVGKIYGKCYVDEEIGNRGVVESVNNLELDFTKMDVSNLFDVKFILDLIYPLLPNRPGSYMFNYGLVSDSMPHFDIDVRLNRVLYKRKQIGALGVKIRKRSRQFTVTELYGNSEIFVGKGSMSFDVSGGARPYIVANFNFDKLDLETLASTKVPEEKTTLTVYDIYNMSRMQKESLFSSIKDGDKITPRDEKTSLQGFATQNIALNKDEVKGNIRVDVDKALDSHLKSTLYDVSKLAAKQVDTSKENESSTGNITIDTKASAESQDNTPNAPSTNATNSDATMSEGTGETSEETNKEVIQSGTRDDLKALSPGNTSTEISIKDEKDKQAHEGAKVTEVDKEMQKIQNPMPADTNVTSSISTVTPTKADSTKGNTLPLKGSSVSSSDSGIKLIEDQKSSANANEKETFAATMQASIKGILSLFSIETSYADEVSNNNSKVSITDKQSSSLLPDVQVQNLPEAVANSSSNKESTGSIVSVLSLVEQASTTDKLLVFTNNQENSEGVVNVNEKEKQESNAEKLSIPGVASVPEKNGTLQDAQSGVTSIPNGESKEEVMTNAKLPKLLLQDEDEKREKGIFEEDFEKKNEKFNFAENEVFVARGQTGDDSRRIDNYIGKNIDFPVVERLDGDIFINIRNLKLPYNLFGSKDVDAFILEGKIDDGEFKFSRFFVKQKVKSLEMRGKAFSKRNIVFEADAIGENIPLAQIIDFFVLDSKIEGTASFGARLKSRGRTVKDFINNAQFDAEFDSPNLKISRPNINGLYETLGIGRHITPLEAEDLINRPSETRFVLSKGSLSMSNGILTAEEIIMKAIGFTGRSKISVQLVSGEIDLIKTNFVLLGYKPWAVGGKKANRFLKIPLSTTVNGTLNSYRTTNAMERVNEYIRELERYDSESKEDQI